jgi:mxaD protein
MAQIDNQVTIARSADDVWAILGDLEHPDRWAPGIAAVRIEGDTRICQLPDGMGEIHENVTVTERDRQFSYEQTKHPLPLTVSRGTLTVTPAQDGATVTWNATVEFADPALESQFLPMLQQGYAAALENLRALLQAPSTTVA